MRAIAIPLVLRRAWVRRRVVLDPHSASRALPRALTTHRAAARFAQPCTGLPLYLLLMVLRE
jgi:hypothetical protein